MGLNINNTNYNQYKKVYEIFWHHYSKFLDARITDENSPLKILNDWEQHDMRIAKRGLKEGLRDSISSLTHYPPKTKKDIDDDLIKNQLPRILSLQSLIKDSIKKVFTRKTIKTIDEFYIIKEIVDDMTSELTDGERKNLSQYLSKFESVQKR